MRSELVKPTHLARRAVVYIRQSTTHQVVSNQESLRLQYALQQRARELGWREADIDVIDADLGLSGASAAGRSGFKELVGRVGLNEIGLILSIDVTRLARNCTDWYPLLDICGLHGCLIADRDGVYDPGSANGRLLLGLKGTISELELHTIRSRLTAGLLAKAERGELALTLPVGLVRDPSGVVVKDPNLEVQERLSLLFETFLKVRSVAKVMREFNARDLELPRRDRHGDLTWASATTSAVAAILKNPAYAGAFVYGRTRLRKPSDGKSAMKAAKPIEEWRIVVKDRYPAYIDWKTYEKIRGIVSDNRADYMRKKTRGAPRDGELLLTGIAWCGRCGHKMYAHYKTRPEYVCNHLNAHQGLPACQYVGAPRVDAAVTQAFLQALAPAEIENLKLTIAKLQHDAHGKSSERTSVLMDQLELQLGELIERRAQEKAAGEIAAAAQSTTTTKQEPLRQRQKPARRPLDAKLPRERRVEPAPTACPCCGGKLRKLGEDVTEMLERVPASWKVIQIVREKMTCRTCEAITQPPAPSHPIARGRAGPQLLAEVLFGKYGAHLPLNRQSDIFAGEGVEIDVSTLADWVGACAATLMPLRDAIEKHAHAAERLHVDDTTVPVLAKNQCRTGRLWAHVRDDRPFGGKTAPAAVFYYSPTREGEHAERQLATYTGIVQADAYSGFNGLFVEGRQPGPIVEAACWAHSRRKFFELARLRKMPIAIEAVQRIDALFAIEREINGKTAAERLAVRRTRSKPLVESLETWLRAERKKLSAKGPLAKAADYQFNHWVAFTRFLDDGRICLSNNAAERAIRGIAVGRRNWTFCGSDSGGHRAAVMFTLIETAKLADVDPKAWLADVLARIADHPAQQIEALLPWNWKAAREAKQAA